MKCKRLKLEGLTHIYPEVFEDERGHFFETYKQETFTDIVGEEISFVQDNQSYSHNGVIRGLHYQLSPFQQGKLIRVVHGEIFDVAVDLRSDSKTFGEWEGVILNGNNKGQLWVPEGFAHGFLTLSKTAIVVYKCTKPYAPSHQGILKWNDPTINIKWPFEKNITISQKDIEGSPFCPKTIYF